MPDWSNCCSPVNCLTCLDLFQISVRNAALSGDLAQMDVLGTNHAGPGPPPRLADANADDTEGAMGWSAPGEGVTCLLCDEAPTTSFDDLGAT